MGPKKFRLIPVLLIIAILAVGTYFVITKLSFKIIPTPEKKSEVNNQTSSSPVLLQKNQGPRITLVKKNRTLIVSWENLPAGAVKIVIYRERIGETAWKEWKTVTLSTGTPSFGRLEIKLGAGDDVYLYNYYTKVINDSGKSLWTSSSTRVVAASSSPDFSPLAPQTLPPPGNPTPSSTLSASSSTSSSSSTTPPPGSSLGSSVYYYPSGAASQSAPGDFWVIHIDQRIEIGWQRLPAGTDTVVVSRSSLENGPWTVIINQINPADPYFIRVLDGTLNNARYYKMETYAGGNLLRLYGPLLLPPL